MGKCRDLVNLLGTIKRNIKDISKMVSFMERERFSIQMGKQLMELGLKE